jgi:23S rRNA pseudouridine2604 synthase
METKAVYPMRINKYLAQKKLCSRREADQLVSEKKIAINGQIAILGARVNEGDVVEVIKKVDKDNIYLAFNKPRGIITHSPQGEEKSIADIFSFSPSVYPIGRLDKDSSGLIILTNDGRVTGKLLNPDQENEKEYVVRTNKPINESFLRRMEQGVLLDNGYRTRGCQIKRIGDMAFVIVLTEGKKRQIRRMCTMLGYEVVELERVRILNIKLGNLHSGKYRRIEGEELKTFLMTLGIDYFQEGAVGKI